MTLLFLDVDGTLLPFSGPVFRDDPNPLFARLGPAHGPRLWKTRVLGDWAAGRPFAWVDDEITGAGRDWVAAHHPGRALLHRVDTRQGLTDADYDVLSVWTKGT